MKKIVAAVLMISLMVSMMALAVSAELLTSKSRDTLSLVVFGDSISTGYGLEGTIYTRASYINQVAEALGVSEGAGYVNYAVDGYTSTRIFYEVNQRSAEVAGADLIILTCGGNDLLGQVIDIAKEITGTSNLEQAAMAMLFMPETDLMPKLNSDANRAIIDAALVAYESNMTALVDYLKTTAPNARILFLTQYNPLSGLAFAPQLDAYAEDAIVRLNAIMTEVVENAGCEIVDTYSVMVGKGMELSNILSSDIHPNAAGHTAMADMVKAHLGLSGAGQPGIDIPVFTTAEPHITTRVPEITTTATETTKATETSATTSETTTKVSETTVQTSATTIETTTAVTETTTKAPVTTTGTTIAVSETEPQVIETTTAVSETEPQVTETTTATTAVTPSETSTNAGTTPPTEDETPVWTILLGVFLFVIGVGSGIGIVLLIKKQ